MRAWPGQYVSLTNLGRESFQQLLSMRSESYQLHSRHELEAHPCVSSNSAMGGHTTLTEHLLSIKRSYATVALGASRKGSEAQR
jgi:hypothetical protein